MNRFSDGLQPIPAGFELDGLGDFEKKKQKNSLKKNSLAGCLFIYNLSDFVGVGPLNTFFGFISKSGKSMFNG